MLGPFIGGQRVVPRGASAERTSGATSVRDQLWRQAWRQSLKSGHMHQSCKLSLRLCVSASPESSEKLWVLGIRDQAGRPESLNLGCIALIRQIL